MNFCSVLKKYWLLILGCLSVAVVVIGLKDYVLPPVTRLELIDPTAFVRTDRGMVVVDNYHQRLVFTNKDYEVIRVLEVGHREVPFDKVYGVFSVDDHIFVSATVSKDNGIVLSGEILAEYSPEGKYLRDFHKVDYAVKEDMVRAGFQNVEKSDWGLLLTSLRGREIKFEEVTYIGPRTLASHKLDFVPWKTFKVDEMECLILGVDGWYRHYDGNKDSLTLLDRVGAPYEDFILEVGKLPLSLPLSSKFLLKTFVFWGGVGVLALISLILFGRYLLFLRYDPTPRKRFLMLMGAVIVASIISGFYSNYVYKVTMKHYTVMADVECRIAYDTLVDRHADLLKILKKEDVVDVLNSYENSRKIQNLAASILKIAVTNGSHEAFSGALLIKDREGKTRIIADTTLDEPDGTVYWDLDVQDKDFEEQQDFFVAADEDANGKYLTGFRKLYRDDGTCFGFLNLDINTKKIYTEQRTLAVKAFMELLIIIIGLYVAVQFVVKAAGEFGTVLQKKRMGKEIVGAELVGTCAFLAGLCLSLDDVLFPFALKELCTNYGGDFIKLSSILVTTKAVGSFVMSVCYPKLRALLSDRVVLVIGVVGILSAFATIISAFLLHIPGLYVAGFTLFCAFVSGILKPSILSLPLQFTDSEQRSLAVNKSYTAYSMASAGAILLGVAIQHFFGFVALYAFAFVLLLLSSFLFVFAMSYAPKVERGYSSFNYRTMWEFFTSTKGLGYLFSMSLTIIPIYLFTYSVCGTLLARIGVDARLVTFITICGFILYTIFPRENIAQKYGKKFTGTVFVCCGAFAFVLTAGNNSVEWIMTVAMLAPILYSKDLSDNVLMELTEVEGYDKKTILDGNVFLVNFLTMLLSWLVSMVLVLDEATVCWGIGCFMIVMLIIGKFFDMLGKRSKAA